MRDSKGLEWGMFLCFQVARCFIFAIRTMVGGMRTRKTVPGRPQTRDFRRRRPGRTPSRILFRTASPDCFVQSLAVLSFHRGCPVRFAPGVPRALRGKGNRHRTAYSSCEIPAGCDRAFLTKQAQAVRVFVPVYAGRLLGPYALNRGTILLDYFDPLSEPLSKLCVLLDLGFHWLVRTNGHITGLLRSVELGVLAGGAQKKLTIETREVYTHLFRLRLSCVEFLRCSRAYSKPT